MGLIFKAHERGKNRMLTQRLYLKDFFPALGDNGCNWNVIEQFAEYMGNRDDVWYATNIEIHDYVEAYRKLIVSTNGENVYNPTGEIVYFQRGEKTYCVQPGERLKI